jgi:DNA-binding transcriptional LysR family regulator
MDTLNTMRLFARIVERRNFGAAAADLGLPRSTATSVIKQMEARLGRKLLTRSTRHVAPTPEGEAYYERCIAILADIEDAEDAVSSTEVRGLLRVDMHGYLARSILIPALPGFLARHPQLRMHIGDGDRLVDLVREGVDCVIRSGELAESDMIARRLGSVQEITCATPDYLSLHGTPVTPDDLGGHFMVGFVSSRTGQALPLEFIQNGQVREITLPCRVSASNSETTAALAIAGYGLIQAPRHRLQREITAGRLVEVLSDYPLTPMPVSLLYPRNRHPSPRLRTFIDWVVEIVSPHLD